jgi:hypothetical protein
LEASLRVNRQVIDGRYGVDASVLNNRNVDICSSHYYEGGSMVDRMKDDIAVRGRSTLIT